MSRLRRLGLPAAVFFAPFAAYVALLPTTTSFEDSAEFVTAAATLGIPHPSGYPLYVLLAHPFVWLPFGTVPWRVTLFSAVCAAMAVWLVFLLGRRILAELFQKSGWLAETAVAAVCLLFAFSPLWWSQAIYAKMYALHVLLVLACLYALLRWSGAEAKKIWLYAAALLLGLSAANHFSLTVIAAPALLAAAVLFNPAAFRKLKTWAGVVLAGLAGLLPYAFILIRAKIGAPYSFGKPDTLAGLAQHVLRSGYGDVGLSGWNRFGFVTSFFGRWAGEMGFVGVLLAVAGAVFLLYRTTPLRRAVAVAALGLIASPMLIPFLRIMDWSAQADYVYRVYYLHAIAAGYLLSAVGAGLALAALATLGWTRSARVLAAVLVLTAAVAAVFGIAPLAPYRCDFPERYARAVLDALPQDSVLVLNEDGFTADTLLFTLAYLQAAEGLRPDVTVVFDTGVWPFYAPPEPAGYYRFDRHWRRIMVLRTALADPLLKGRPIFSTFMPLVAETRPVPTDGIVFAVRCDAACRARFRGQPVPLAVPTGAVYENQMALGSIMGHVLYGQAAVAVRDGDQKKAEALVVRAINLSSVPFDDDFVAFMAYRSEVMAGH